MFSCEFCEISKITFFTEHLWMGEVLRDWWARVKKSGGGGGAEVTRGFDICFSVICNYVPPPPNFRILRLSSSGRLCGNVLINFFIVEIKTRFTCNESNLYENVVMFHYIISVSEQIVALNFLFSSLCNNGMNLKMNGGKSPKNLWYKFLFQRLLTKALTLQTNGLVSIWKGPLSWKS